jgi:hypothetical protein
MEMMMRTEQHQRADECDWCGSDLGKRIFQFEGKRYCCWTCMDRGAPYEMSKPLFETGPFPAALHRLRAHVRQI